MKISGKIFVRALATAILVMMDLFVMLYSKWREDWWLILVLIVCTIIYVIDFLKELSKK